jgi:hypothetical protein
MDFASGLKARRFPGTTSFSYPQMAWHEIAMMIMIFGLL